MAGQYHALVGTSIMQMGVDKAGVMHVIFSQFPLSIEELYQAMGRAGRGTKFTATVELVFDVRSASWGA
jgi:superfamily II DNA helicase RecQ